MAFNLKQSQMRGHCIKYTVALVASLMIVFVLDSLVYHKFDLVQSLAWNSLDPSNEGSHPHQTQNDDDNTVNTKGNVIGESNSKPKTSKIDSLDSASATREDMTEQSAKLITRIAEALSNIVSKIVKASSKENSRDSSEEGSSNLNEKDSLHNFRLPNRLITDYDPYLVAKVKRLADRKAPGNDPEVVELARQMMDHPHTPTPKLARFPFATDESKLIDSILNQTEGKFIECGGYDGEVASSTIFFERLRGWTGLLVEADPGYYTQLLGKQRNVYSINACLSPHPYFSVLPYKYSDSYNMGGQLGRLAASDHEASQASSVPCFPTETLLLALNWTTVDFFSLDVEGMELPILRTIPWTKFNIRTLAVEFIHGKEGKQAYLDYMAKQDYSMVKEVHVVNLNFGIFNEDFIFVKNANSTVSTG